MIRSRFFLVTVFIFATRIALAQSGPRVLVVDAHPDDETAYAASIYKITHNLHGTVDLVVITNGEGGYKYSTLAEPIYHLKLTNEKIGRKYLPAIRQKEQEAAGKIIGLNHIYFLKQRDNRYTLDPHEVLDSNWNIPWVKSQLKSILMKGHYDFVFTLLPEDSTHGHHKAATILALNAVKDLPSNISHPIVLAAEGTDTGRAPKDFTELKGFPITRVSDGHPAFQFNKLQSFGFHHIFNYKVIVDWEMVEHKSQGTLQVALNKGDIEKYYFFDINPSDGRAKAKALFDRLAQNDYPELTYPGAK